MTCRRWSRRSGRLADAADRAVFLCEAIAVEVGLVIPEDVGMEKDTPE